MSYCPCGKELTPLQPIRDETCGSCEHQERHDDVVKRSVTMDRQVGGSHYKDKAIQPIDYIMANGLDFNEGSVVKYITRHKEKGGAQDIEKIKQYCDFIMKYTYGK